MSLRAVLFLLYFFFFQAEDGIRDTSVTGVQTCALPIWLGVVVWLEADEDILFERAARRGNRPLLATDDPRTTLAKILAERTPLYTKAADIRLNTADRGHEEVTDLILAEIENRTVP